MSSLVVKKQLGTEAMKTVHAINFLWLDACQYQRQDSKHIFRFPYYRKVSASFGTQQFMLGVFYVKLQKYWEVVGRRERRKQEKQCMVSWSWQLNFTWGSGSVFLGDSKQRQITFVWIMKIWVILLSECLDWRLSNFTEELLNDRLQERTVEIVLGEYSQLHISIALNSEWGLQQIRGKSHEMP